jgi:hypothetical protein
MGTRRRKGRIAGLDQGGEWNLWRCRPWISRRCERRKWIVTIMKRIDDGETSSTRPMMSLAKKVA